MDISYVCVYHLFIASSPAASVPSTRALTVSRPASAGIAKVEAKAFNKQVLAQKGKVAQTPKQDAGRARLCSRGLRPRQDEKEDDTARK